MTSQTIVDKETKTFLNSMSANIVREYATNYWPSASGADWDGKRLFLRYNGSIKPHWYACSGTMAKELASWIKSKN